MAKTEHGREFYIRKAFKENYGVLMRWGGMYLGSWITPTVYLLNTGSHALFLMYTAYLSLDDIGPMAEALHFVVLLTTACTSVLNSLSQRNRLDNILEAMGRGFYDYGKSMDEVSKREIKIHENVATRRKLLLPRLFITSVLISGFAISIRPLIEYLIVGKFKEYRGDGINRTTTVAVWVPFIDPSILWQNVLVFFLQYVIIWTTPGVVFGTDIMFLCMAEDFSLQLRIIGIAFKRSGQRAMDLYKNLIEEKRYLGQIYSKQELFKKCLEHCIAQTVEHHSLIIDLFYHFRLYNRVMLLWLLVGATFLLCLSGILFVSDKVSLLSKVTFFCFLATELVHTFIFCWYGEQLQRLSMDIGKMFYNSDWFQYSSLVKQDLLLVQKRTNAPLKLTAAGFMDVNLNSYSNVLSSAYSYFNLLSAVKH
ncbi:odorant receptor 67c-like [Rhodnius prolixus]|uniref:Odorant receptor n=1 Tax=Rhodnius prolixus TaxID=13249 RepID=T1H8G0_RHOPR